MDKVTFVKSQLKLEHWRKLIAECQSSGMQVKQWCAQNEISKDQYYYWLRKVREKLKCYTKVVTGVANKI